MAGSTELLTRQPDSASGRNDPRRGGALAERGTEALRLSALLEVISDFLFVVGGDGRILDFRSCRDTEFEIPADVVVGKRVAALLPGPLAEEVMGHIHATLESGRATRFHCHHPLPGGFAHFEVRLAKWADRDVVAMVRDVTERHMLQKELLDISQRERDRIGQDLHVGLGQHLTGISFLSKALRNKLRARGLAEAEEAFEIGQQVLQAISQTRNLARGLFPVEVESHGLQVALQELAATAQERFQISCTLECDQPACVDDEADATHLFRLAQEAVSNSVKHGKATAVKIRLVAEGDRYVLSVCDNGKGFTLPRAGQNGLGLRIMNYRAQKVGGELHIGGGPDGGTEVRCVFPRRSGSSCTECQT